MARQLATLCAAVRAHLTLVRLLSWKQDIFRAALSLLDFVTKTCAGNVQISRYCWYGCGWCYKDLTLVCKILTWKCFPWTFLLYLCDFFCAQSGWSSSWRPNNHLLKIKDHYLLEHLKMAKFSRETKTFVVFLFSSPCRRTRRCRCVLWRSGPFAFGGRRSRRVCLSEPTPENIVKTNLSHLPKVQCHRDLKAAKKSCGKIRF